MKEEKKNCLFKKMTQKVEKMENSLKKLKEEIKNLTNVLGPDEPEICRDEVESDREIQKMLQEAILESVINKDPIGEA